MKRFAIMCLGTLVFYVFLNLWLELLFGFKVRLLGVRKFCGCGVWRKVGSLLRSRVQAVETCYCTIKSLPKSGNLVHWKHPFYLSFKIGDEGCQFG